LYSYTNFVVIFFFLSGLVNDFDFAKTLPVGVRHVGDNCAVPDLDEKVVRMRRHILLAGCQNLVWPYWREVITHDTGEITKKSEFRVSVCCRHPVDEAVKIYQNESAVGYSGITRCGNVWACPVCCAKVMRRRSEQIGALFDAVHKAGGSAVMVTWTAASQISYKLGFSMSAFKDAKRTLTQNREYRSLAKLRTGAVTATELTYNSTNGWHVHQHDVWFFFSKSPDCDYLADSLFKPWFHACKKHGLHTQAAYRGRRIGVDVRPSWDASEYLAKFDRERSWSLSSEMTAGRLKTAQGQSMTPWALLEDAIVRGKNSPTAALWLEYLRATKGKSVISVKAAKTLLESFNLPCTLNDLADANKTGLGEVIASISPAQFDRAVRDGRLGQILEAARSGAHDRVHQLLQT
jgi:hypothetical protein